MPFNGLYALDVASRCIQGECDQIEAFTGRPYQIDEVLQAVLNFNGPKWSIHYQDKAVAVAGLLQHSKTRFESWFLSTPECWTPGIGVTEIVKRVVAQTLENGARRIETVCLADRTTARRWYEMIGLRFETTLEQYGVNGAKAVQYVATREGTA